MKNRTVHIAYITDQKYAEPTLVSVASAVHNKSWRTKLNVYVIATGLTAVERFSFEKLSKHNAHVRVLNVENCFNQVNTTHRHVSKAAMLKFKLATLFPHLNKLLYIDGDTVVQHDLLELYNTDLHDTYAGVCVDLCAVAMRRHHERLGLPSYFNSGVMLLNLKKIRQDDIEAKLLENKLNDKWKCFMDQDAFNQTFAENVTWLNPRYNVMMLNDNSVSLSFPDKAEIRGVSESELWHAYDDATIVHLSNGFKPWDHIEAWDYNLWNLYKKYAERVIAEHGLVDIHMSANGKKKLRLFGHNLLSWRPKTTQVKFKDDFQGLKLCFFEYGGVGDCLLVLPLLEQIYKKSPVAIKIDFYCRFPDLCKDFYFLNYVGDRTPVDELNNRDYDAVFQVIRYARFVSGNREKIKHEYPLLDKYIESDNIVRAAGSARDSLRMFNDFALALGKKRQNQIDLFDIFSDDYSDFSGIELPDEEKTLKKYRLIPKNYITINRGCDGVYSENHPKLWPLEYYDRLIELIHENYPDVQIIQVGKDDKFGFMTGVNKNLIGKTDFQEIAAIMKNAIIHIDVEGGLVHLNHFVHGQSLVLFGPTPMSVYGYPENINIQGTCKLGSCYGITPKWSEKCVLDTDATCMRSITPEMAFKELNKFLVLKLNTWFKIVNQYSGKEFAYPVDDITPMRLPKLPKNDLMFKFDIDTALESFPDVKRFGLVFFMGIGDYFYSTAFIEKLKAKYPHIHFDAYVSKNFDTNNSPLVADCLKTNPYIENVYMFDGVQDSDYWASYNYDDVYNMTDTETLVLPMLYFHTENTPNRLVGLCKVFGMDIPEINMRPVVYDYTPGKIVDTAFNKISKTKKPIVFVQTTTRSTEYHYKYTNTLIKQLIKSGFFVITPEQVNITSNDLYVINTKRFKITDSIALLKKIKESGKEVYVWAFASCFPSVAAALDIPCLITQFFVDKYISTVYFSNMYLITHKYYPQIATDRQFVMQADEYTLDNDYAVYKPAVLVNVFKKFVDIIDNKG